MICLGKHANVGVLPCMYIIFFEKHDNVRVLLLRCTFFRFFSQELNASPTEDGSDTETEDVPVSKGRWSALLRLQKEMNHLVEGKEFLSEQAFCGQRKLFGRIQRLASSIELCGQDPSGKSNAFVRPRGLTKRQRLGVVDIYHGGKKGKSMTFGDKVQTPVLDSDVVVAEVIPFQCSLFCKCAQCLLLSLC